MSPNGLPSQKILEGHTAAITVVGFSADGKFLASAANNGVVLVFSTSSWTPICQFLDVSPVSVLVWHQKRRYLLFCGHQSGDLHVLTMSKSMVCLSPCVLKGLLTMGKQKCTTVKTSTFAGCIHSISLSPTLSRIAIAYGNEIVLTDIIPGPYRLEDNKKLLPKPPASPHSTGKSGGPIAKSLQFTRKNRLVATYTAHGIVYVHVTYHWVTLKGNTSVWDTDALTISGEIIPRTFPM